MSDTLSERDAGSSVMRRLGTARRAYRREGLSGILAAATSRARVDVFHVFATPLDPLPPLVAPTVPLTFGWLQESELDDYDAFRAGPAGESAAARRAAGDRCFVARRDGAIVSSRWISAGTLREECFPFSFRLRQGEVYEWSVVPPVLPARRFCSRWWMKGLPRLTNTTSERQWDASAKSMKLPAWCNF